MLFVGVLSCIHQCCFFTLAGSRNCIPACFYVLTLFLCLDVPSEFMDKCTSLHSPILMFFLACRLFSAHLPVEQTTKVLRSSRLDKLPVNLIDDEDVPHGKVLCLFILHMSIFSSVWTSLSHLYFRSRLEQWKMAQHLVSSTFTC